MRTYRPSAGTIAPRMLRRFIRRLGSPVALLAAGGTCIAAAAALMAWRAGLENEPRLLAWLWYLALAVGGVGLVAFVLGAAFWLLGIAAVPLSALARVLPRRTATRFRSVPPSAPVDLKCIVSPNDGRHAVGRVWRGVDPDTAAGHVQPSSRYYRRFDHEMALYDLHRALEKLWEKAVWISDAETGNLGTDSPTPEVMRDEWKRVLRNYETAIMNAEGYLSRFSLWLHRRRLKAIPADFKDFACLPVNHPVLASVRLFLDLY